MNSNLAKHWHELSTALALYTTHVGESGEQSYDIDAMAAIPLKLNADDRECWEEIEKDVPDDLGKCEIDREDRALFVKLTVIRLENALKGATGKRRLTEGRDTWGLLCDTSRVFKHQQKTGKEKWETLNRAYAHLGEHVSELSPTFDRLQYSKELPEINGYVVARLIFELASKLEDISKSNADVQINESGSNKASEKAPRYLAQLPSDVAQAVEMKNNGSTWDEVEKACGVSKTTIRRKAGQFLVKGEPGRKPANRSKSKNRKNS